MTARSEKLLKQINELLEQERFDLIKAIEQQGDSNYVSTLNRDLLCVFKIGVQKITEVLPSGLIKVLIATPYGSFEGFGRNKKVAGEDAAFKALLQFPKHKN